MENSNSKKNYSRLGMINMCVNFIYRALLDNEDILSNVYLSNALYLIEESTGVTLDTIKQYVKKPYETTIINDELASTFETMTIKEIAQKLNKSEVQIRNYVIRHNIKYKKPKRVDLEKIAEEIMAMNGVYSYTDMVTKTHHALYLVKKACEVYNIPHK